jgi:multidrug transporter EmrE-like cation transporter
MQYVIALCGALVLNAMANLMLKIGSTKVQAGGGFLADGLPGAARALLTSPVLLTGLVCFGLNACLYMFALQSKTLKISIAYPVMVGGGYAIIAVTAACWPTLRERLTAGQWFGVALVLAGVFVIAVGTPADTATP